MATSFIDFKNRGFWCEDSYLEVWLNYFSQIIETMDSIPEWLLETKNEWIIQASSGFTGCIELQLDSIITTSERKDLIEQIIIKTNLSLLEHGDYITKEDLNSLRLHIGLIWLDSEKTSNFTKVGKLLIELINENLDTTVSLLSFFRMVMPFWFFACMYFLFKKLMSVTKARIIAIVMIMAIPYFQFHYSPHAFGL